MINLLDYLIILINKQRKLNMSELCSVFTSTTCLSDEPSICKYDKVNEEDLGEIGELYEMMVAMEKVASNCSLKVGMQMQTQRKNGKKLMKEKVFHIIWENESELVKTDNIINEEQA